MLLLVSFVCSSGGVHLDIPVFDLVKQVLDLLLVLFTGLHQMLKIVIARFSASLVNELRPELVLKGLRRLTGLIDRDTIIRSV